jgi:hypothetical protein
MENNTINTKTHQSTGTTLFSIPSHTKHKFLLKEVSTGREWFVVCSTDEAFHEELALIHQEPFNDYKVTPI